MSKQKKMIMNNTDHIRPLSPIHKTTMMLIMGVMLIGLIFTMGCKTAEGTKGELWTAIVDTGKPEWKETGKPNLDAIGEELVVGYATELYEQVVRLKAHTEGERVFRIYMNSLTAEEKKLGEDPTEEQLKQVRADVLATASDEDKATIRAYIKATEEDRNAIGGLLVKILPKLPAISQQLSAAGKELKPDAKSLGIGLLKGDDPLAPIKSAQGSIDYINQCNTLMEKLKAVAADWAAG
jgi:hypothetical protein